MLRVSLNVNQCKTATLGKLCLGDVLSTLKGVTGAGGSFNQASVSPDGKCDRRARCSRKTGEVLERSWVVFRSIKSLDLYSKACVDGFIEEVTQHEEPASISQTLKCICEFFN